jgi:hypothetical protein
MEEAFKLWRIKIVIEEEYLAVEFSEPDLLMAQNQ